MIVKFQLHQLYVEVLYTIQNKLGASCPQFSHFKDELLAYVQEAFGVNKKLHEQLLAVATDEKVKRNVGPSLEITTPSILSEGK